MQWMMNTFGVKYFCKASVALPLSQCPTFFKSSHEIYIYSIGPKLFAKTKDWFWFELGHSLSMLHENKKMKMLHDYGQHVLLTHYFKAASDFRKQASNMWQPLHDPSHISFILENCGNNFNFIAYPWLGNLNRSLRSTTVYSFLDVIVNKRWTCIDQSVCSWRYVQK